MVLGAVFYAEHRSAPDYTALFEDIIANSRSEDPKSGLARDWFDCIERDQPAQDVAATKTLCKAWTVQGVTSELYMLNLSGERIPVVESRLAGTQEAGLLIVDVVGGPGNKPYHADPTLTEEFIQKLRKHDMLEIYRGAIVKDLPQYQLMQRGFTIASLGYWGMSIRTLNEHDEIELAVQDVRLALNYYRDQLGKDPPLITASLGNHLVLGAIGQNRLENADVLALVPVMDGLQHHVSRFVPEMVKIEADGGHQGYAFYNVYTRTDNGVEFDHSRALRTRDFAVQFFGDADYGWRDVSLSGSCSKVILGSEDPRTKAYLEAHNDLPSFIEVWDSGHDIVQDAPEQTRRTYADYANCLLAQKPKPASKGAN